MTLTETGTHSSIDASVGGFRGGEPELAIAMAGSAAGMLVIMDRGFPGVALWKAYTQARAHLLIRARSRVAEQAGAGPGRRDVPGADEPGRAEERPCTAGSLVRVIEYRVDGSEVIRLLTDLMDPAAFPAGELAALYHQRWESESSFRQVGGRTFQHHGRQEILRSADPELVPPGDMGAPGGAPLPDPDHHAGSPPGGGTTRTASPSSRSSSMCGAASSASPRRQRCRSGRSWRRWPRRSAASSTTASGACGRPTDASSARRRSTPSARQARSAVLPAGSPPRYSRSIPRYFQVSQATALARHLQVEQDRAPAVLPDHPGLARQAADQLRRHHQHHQQRSPPAPG